MSVSLAPNWAITNAPAYGHLGWYNEEDQGVAYHWGNNMTKPIVQSVTFKASPEELFEIFTDSKKHSAATGAKASTSAKAPGDSRPHDRPSLASLPLEGLRPRLNSGLELFQDAGRRQN